MQRSLSRNVLAWACVGPTQHESGCRGCTFGFLPNVIQFSNKRITVSMWLGLGGPKFAFLVVASIRESLYRLLGELI